MILVTGGTGLIGGEVLRRLSQAGVPVRALTRDLTKSREPPGVTWVAGDLAKPETLRAAFEGAGTLFLLTHYYEDMVELQHNAIAAARAAGVSHVVKVSAFAASGHSRAPIGRWHFQVEMTLQDSGSDDAGSFRQEVRGDRQRGAVLPPGRGHHRRRHWQAGALRRRVTRTGAGAPHSRRPSTGCDRERSGDLRLSAGGRENGDDHEHHRRSDGPAA